jgi:hypothetical protein
MDWLDSFSPMTCHWKEKSISFNYKGQWVTLQGVIPATVPPPAQMDFNMLQPLQANNDIWAMAVLEHDVAPLSISSDSDSSSVQVLLSEFEDVFSEPQGLPPHR